MNRQYDTVAESLGELLKVNPFKIVLSNADKNAQYRKIDIEKKEKDFLVSKYTQKQVFHEHIGFDDLQEFVESLLGGGYSQLNAWGDLGEAEIKVTKKSKVFVHTSKANCEVCAKHTTSHNRTKKYLLEEGTVIEPLVDMGIFTKEGRIVRTMYDKYKQINRFIEVIDDYIKKNDYKHLNIIDFGCGKSYLTFIVYYYLTEIRGIDAHIIGLDLKADVIEKCNAAAEKYNYTNLKFELGDINGFAAPFDVDMVITLHACDTATDYALYNAIKWNAKMIFSVPCCQHELNFQIRPENLKLISKYGIISERFCALATDAIRGNILEACGYTTQIMEFVDLSHTPKNLLIRAIKDRNVSEKSRSAAVDEIRTLNAEFGFEPTLCKLLKDELQEM